MQKYQSYIANTDMLYMYVFQGVKRVYFLLSAALKIRYQKNLKARGNGSTGNEPWKDTITLTKLNKLKLKQQT